MISDNSNPVPYIRGQLCTKQPRELIELIYGRIK